jgi:protein O-mannosyl-transferase
MTDPKETPPSSDPSPVSSPPAEPMVLKLPDESSTPKDLALWAGMLVILTLIAYWPATDGQFISNDDRNVSANSLLAIPGGLGEAWFGRWSHPDQYPLAQYHPAAFTSDWVSYHLFGHDDNGLPIPFPYHLGNLLLHAGAVVLLWFVLRKIHLPGAWLAAAVFAVHPLNSEAVAWISQRDSVMCAVFFFASIYTFLLFVEEDEKELAKVPGSPAAPGAGDEKEPPVDPARRWGLYAASVVLFKLAMLSKSIAFAMPVIVLLLLWQQRRFKLRYVGFVVPMAIIAVVLGLYAADFEVGITGSFDLSIAQRFIIAGSALWFYAAKILLPVRLTFLYPQWGIDSSNLLQFVPLVLAIVIMAGAWLARKQIGRGPLVALLAFGGCLFPLLGFYNITPMQVTFVADHYAYLATAPVIALVIAAIARAFRSVRPTGSNPSTAIGLSAILLVGLGAMTWDRSHVYSNSLSLWQDTAAKNPDSWLVQFQLATALRDQANSDFQLGDADSLRQAADELDQALTHVQLAAKLDPKNASPQFTWASILIQQQHVANSIKAMPASTQPDWSPIVFQPNLIDQAIDHFTAATQLDPARTDAWEKLAGLRVDRKQYPEAIAAANAGLANQPSPLTQAALHQLLALAYAGLGGKDHEARAAREDVEAIRLQPDNLTAHEHLAQLLEKAGKDKDAIAQWRVVAEIRHSLNRDRPEVWSALARLFAKQYDYTSAVQFYKAAVALDPDSDALKKNLADAIEKQKRQAATRPTTAPALNPNGQNPNPNQISNPNFQ